MAPEKTEGPAQVLSFAGIELDCNRQEARLPMEKVTKCLTAISQLQSRKKVTLKDLQSILGLLNFACSVIIPGRVFLRRLINLTIGIKKPYHFIRLNTEVKKDLRIWQTFLDSFNGSPFSLRKAGLHLPACVFILMPHNLRVTVSFLANNGHTAGSQSHGQNTVLAFLSFFPLSQASAIGLTS